LVLPHMQEPLAAEKWNREASALGRSVSDTKLLVLTIDASEKVNNLNCEVDLVARRMRKVTLHP
jgi:hypothetical protein